MNSQYPPPKTASEQGGGMSAALKALEGIRQQAESLAVNLAEVLDALGAGPGVPGDGRGMEDNKITAVPTGALPRLHSQLKGVAETNDRLAIMIGQLRRLVE